MLNLFDPYPEERVSNRFPMHGNFSGGGSCFVARIPQDSRSLWAAEDFFQDLVRLFLGAERHGQSSPERAIFSCPIPLRQPHVVSRGLAQMGASTPAPDTRYLIPDIES